MSSPSILTAGVLADAFAFNGELIVRNSAGLTHTDSLLEPGNGQNSLNWLLGHILVYRDIILGLLGAEKVFAEGDLARYVFGSDPVSGDGDGVLTLEALLEGVERSQGQIATALSRATPEQLAADTNSEYGSTVGRMVHFFYFHETYHLGQTEPARNVAGKAG